MEADLLRFWQIRLTDYWRTPRTLSTRLLLTLVDHIPEGQGAAVHAIDGREWGATEDILDQLRRWYILVHTESHDDPGPHQMNPAAQRADDRVSDDAVEMARRLKAEREAAIAAGEIA